MSSDPYADALTQLCRELSPQRALVLVVNGQELVARATRGLDPDQPWMAAPLSFSVLEHVRQHGHPLLASDLSSDPRFRERSSAVIADIRSVLCVPFWGPSGQIVGLLYADSQVRRGAFGNPELKAAQLIARRLEEQTGGAPPSAPAAPPKAPRPPAARRPTARARPRSMPYFFRALATLVGAGVNIPRALALLSEIPEDPGLAQVLRDVGASVLSGQSLARAMASHPQVFTAFHQRTVGMGEVSGSLHRSLEHVAHYEERHLAMTMAVRSALTYPLMLLAACLVMLILVPPYVLAGHFELARQTGAQLPWISRVVAGISLFLRHPAGQLAVWTSLGLAGFAARSLWSRPGARRRLMEACLEIPLLGRIVRNLALAHFARALAVQLEAGVPLTQALPHAAACADFPGLEERVGRALSALLEGEPLARALRRADFFPGSFLQIMEAGESSGQVPKLLGWMGDFFEQEAQAGLEGFAAWLEPLVMMGMGLIVGVLLLATMIPMVRALEAL